MRFFLFVLATLTACSTDADYDAYPADQDCNDNNPDIHPNANEVCDQIDNDCDGQTDEDAWNAAIVYQDEDGDGFGTDEVTQYSCTVPEGFVDQGADCDDSRSDVHPQASEVCDALATDEDCDGKADDADNSVDPAGQQTWYRDQDLDGFGNEVHVGVLACVAPDVDYVLDNTDCDDTRSEVNPDAPEVPYDGIDQDCDNSDLRDVDGDGWEAEEVGGRDCNDLAADIHPGATESFDFTDSDCDGQGDELILSHADAKLSGDAIDDWAGEAVSSAGDVNGDGFADLIVGGSGTDNDEVSSGAAYILLGSSSGVSDGSLSTASARLNGETENDWAGASVASAGDVNADGFADVIIGAYGDDTEVNNGGAAYIVLGSSSGISDMALSSADAKLTGEEFRGFAGFSVSGAGDVNGDGFADVIVGAYQDDGGGIDTGAAYLLMGSSSGISSGQLSDADTRLTGVKEYLLAGYSVSGAEDVDGDGYSDVLVGGKYTNTTYLILGSAKGISNRSMSSADAKLSGEAAGDYSGTSVAGAGDVNGDGYADVLVGTPEQDSTAKDAGAAYVVLGSASGIGDMNLSGADGKLTGERGGDLAGFSVAPAGDMNGDGFADVLVGAPFATNSDDTRVGAAYLILGSSGGIAHTSLSFVDAKLTGEVGLDNVGYSVSTAADVNGDGYSDLLIGAWGQDTPATDAGAAYLILGFAP